jgi:hypothetical protein
MWDYTAAPAPDHTEPQTKRVNAMVSTRILRLFSFGKCAIFDVILCFNPRSVGSAQRGYRRPPASAARGFISAIFRRGSPCTTIKQTITTAGQKTMLKKILPFTLLAMSGAANAAGGYLGVGFGQSSVDVEPVYYFIDATTSVSDTDTAFKIFGGYEFNRNIALEGGYTYFGEFGVDYRALYSSYFESYKTNAGAFYVAAVGSIPLGPVSLFGKAGLAHWFVDHSDSGDFSRWSRRMQRESIRCSARA